MAETVDIVNICVYVDLVNTSNLRMVFPTFSSIPMFELVDGFHMKHKWLRIKT